MTHIACGFTANIDAVGDLTSGFFQQIAHRCAAEVQKPHAPQPFLHSWDDLRNALMWHVQKGSGAEYIVTDEQLLHELSLMNEWEWAVGGTGLQAACAAVTAGYGALVNLPSWSDDFQFLLARDGLKAVCQQRLAAPVHYIVEYDETTDLGADCIARGVPASNRIILRGLEEFKGRLIATEFAKQIKSRRFNRLLISGYNAVETSAELAALLDETKQFFTALGLACPPAHLELGGIWSLDDQRRIICELGTNIDSLGLNEDELGELLSLDEPLLKLSDSELIAALIRAHETFGVSTLIVHTSQFVAAITHKGEAHNWDDALKNGVRFAAGKAAKGRYCTRQEMTELARTLPVHPRGSKLANLASGKDDVAIVPSFKVEQASTIGLGDTFTAGLLTEAPTL